MRSKRASRSVSLDGRARALRAMGRKGSYTPRYCTRGGRGALYSAGRIWFI